MYVDTVFNRHNMFLLMSIIVQQDATFYSLLYFCKLLYMFRVVTPPITRSTYSYNCNYNIWHWSSFGKCSVLSQLKMRGMDPSLIPSEIGEFSRDNGNLNVARELEVVARCAARCHESTHYSISLPGGVFVGWPLLLLWLFFKCLLGSTAIFMMADNKEQIVCVKFCFLLGKSAAVTVFILTVVAIRPLLKSVT